MISNDGEKGETPSAQRLMPDSPSPDAERPLQPLFRKTSIFNYLALALLVLGGHRWLAGIPNRQDWPDAVMPARFIAADFASAGFAPLKLAGAWKVEIGDPRFGGVSALAIDQGRLVALTDSGTVIRFPRPGAPGPAFVHDLPAGPGSAVFKKNRDSEALARDPAGRGWWVAFENWDQLWLYDPGFQRVLFRINLGRQGWKANRGVEAMVADGDGLMLFPESGGEWLQLRRGQVRTNRLESRFGYISDAARMPDGRLLLVARKIGLAGLAKRLVAVDEGKNGALTLRPLARLSLGATDNIEALAAEPRPGGTRLWLMTDNDFRPRAPTYLVALDLP